MMYENINAGKYNRKISIYSQTITEDDEGFKVIDKTIVLEPYASVKTVKGFTLIKNNSDFDKAFVNFTIRFPKTEITRDMLIDFKGKTYEIQYLNNVNMANVELEMQAKEVTH